MKEKRRNRRRGQDGEEGMKEERRERKHTEAMSVQRKLIAQRSFKTYLLTVKP